MTVLGGGHAKRGVRPNSRALVILWGLVCLYVTSWGGFVHFTELLVALHRVSFGQAVPRSVVLQLASNPSKVQVSAAVASCGLAPASMV